MLLDLLLLFGLPAVVLFAFLLITQKDWSSNKAKVVYVIGVCLTMVAYFGCQEYKKEQRWKELDEDAWLWRQRMEEERRFDSLKASRMAPVDTLASDREVMEVTGSHRSSNGYSSSVDDFFKMGYEDGYEDGCHREKGRLYKKSLRGEDAREYRRGYFEGYADGRADNDVDDEYLYGKNGADYYDLMDDDDWSEDEDFDDDPDEWEEKGDWFDC